MIVKKLKELLGEYAVRTGNDIPEKARGDASLTGNQLPLAYIRPRTVEDVSTVLRACNDQRTAVVVQGGLTGLAGGANPNNQSIVIAMDLLAGIEEIDTEARTMTLLAGTILEVAQKAAEEKGYLLPIDLGARGSCQIGGNLATNAGGVRVIKHGMTRDNVLGLEVVLADGTILSSLNRMDKNNSGYDLKQLFIGSEGTLGVITRAVVKLKPLPTSRATALCALTGYDEAVKLLYNARKRLPGLSAFELMWGTFFQFSCQSVGEKTFDRPCPFAVIIEESGERDCLEEFLAAMFEEGTISDALVAKSEFERDRFWLIRDGLALAEMPGLIEYDVSLSIGIIDLFVRDVSSQLTREFPNIHISVFGHMGDSNIHLCVSAGAAEEWVKERITTIIYGEVRRFYGAISAEHGIGILKRDYLHYTRNQQEIELMRAIKRTLDPNWILNPGKIFAAEARRL